MNKDGYLTFSSEWEMEGFIASAMEEVAKKYKGTVEVDYADHNFKFDCPPENEVEMAAEIDKIFEGFGGWEV